MQSGAGGELILGAGMTGLAAAWSSGAPAFEALAAPGGICRSYLEPAPGGGAYRFEVGGGHWLFGADPLLTRFLSGFVTLRRYRRSSAVYFPASGLLAPYPLQYHLAHLDPGVAARAAAEMRRTHGAPAGRMGDWLEQHFGPTLCELFFRPFHELYTAGLVDEIAPQDAYKSPVDLRLVEQGLAGAAQPAGYNAEFLYPLEGLDGLAGALAQASGIHYGRQVSAINTRNRRVEFSSGEGAAYSTLVSTLPLHRAAALAGACGDEEPDPITGVVVLNIGGLRGPRCPREHWVYVPHSQSGFHRVGFYSNVDERFLPQVSTGRVSVYVERAFRDGGQPAAEETAGYAASVVAELQAWGFLGEVEVVSPTVVAVAYTWQRPGSAWRSRALAALAAEDIHSTGRYGKWQFQGIADSLRDGLLAGAALLAGRRAGGF